MATPVTKKREAGTILLRYAPYYKNEITLLFEAKKGLKPQAVFDFIGLSDLSHAHIEELFHKSMKTFQNYLQNNTLLDSSTSEKLLKLFALYSKGSEVFGSVEAFAEWLSRPAYGIGKEIPQTIMDTTTGIDLIADELLRIQYGDLA